MQFEISFDFIIALKNKSYKANISMKLPCGDLLQNGTCSQEITDMTPYVFKRSNNTV